VAEHAQQEQARRGWFLAAPCADQRAADKPVRGKAAQGDQLSEAVARNDKNAGLDQREQRPPDVDEQHLFAAPLAFVPAADAPRDGQRQQCAASQPRQTEQPDTCAVADDEPAKFKEDQPAEACAESQHQDQRRGSTPVAQVENPENQGRDQDVELEYAPDQPACSTGQKQGRHQAADSPQGAHCGPRREDLRDRRHHWQ
jgi:hypothetical protein